MTRYARNISERSSRQAGRGGFVVLVDEPSPDRVEPFAVALCVIRMARRLGVQCPVPRNERLLPYSDANDNIVFDAPLASWIANKRIRYLRGWKQYQSCVKGFNGLGLIAELVVRDLRRIRCLSVDERQLELRRFLATRKVATAGGNRHVFDEAEAERLARRAPSCVDDLDLAIWRVCARRTIVCSTSSNMGISLHEILRYMQWTKLSVGGKEISLLNEDEGQLIIWCPDEEADFMSPEKTAALRALEAEKPKLTSLHTYINRKQRDPGALGDALNLGGYFFPTNPQSRDELQNLLANSLRTMATERDCKESDLLSDPAVRQVIETLGCTIGDDKIGVREGVESGMSGLMAAYLLMLDESLQDHELLALSTWNQASIGAALAAAVFADEGIREWERLSPAVRQELRELLPALGKWVERHRLGVDVRTRIHGVFDIANLQSLAQLLGVVVEKHSSGRGTAYVGLGSSSYSNGNRCYEILLNSERKGGPFHGKTTFHPATHTLNPIAQAIVVADDLLRAVRHCGESGGAFVAAEAIGTHIRKPEPAGAAALAGYLLTRLDGGTLSVAEMAYPLRLAGFTKALFLEFSGYATDAEGTNWFVQEASEEGEPMEGLAGSFLDCLDMDLSELAKLAAEERSESDAAYRMTSIDPPDFEALNPVVNIYLTGDNTGQASASLIERIVANLRGNLGTLSSLVEGVGEAPSATVGTTGESAPAMRAASPMDLIGYAEAIFRRNGERTFLINAATGRVWTYGQIFEKARTIAAGISRHGIGRGDRMAILLPNGVPLAATYFACLMSGVVAVPVNPALTPKEIGTILRLAKAGLILYSSGTSARLVDAEKERRGSRLQLISDGDAGYEPSTGDTGPRLDLACADTAAWGVPFADCRPDDPFLILFTSGTTALPKGVVHSVRTELGNAVTFNAAMGFDADSRFLHVWPMAYSSGILNTLLSPFMAEGSVVLAGAFDARSALGFWSPVIEQKVNTLWLSPTMLASLHAIDRDTRGPAYCKEFVRRICCGTAALPLALKNNFEKKYGVEVFESYGLTELLIVAAASPRYQRRDKSVGRCLPGVDLRIGNSEESNLQDEFGGEILVNTPYAMAGYVNAESGEIDLLPTGSYFPTGDIGRLDADGNLYITGRKKDLIVRGGQTISPAAVREVLLSCDGVQDAYVLGLPHPFYGEEVAAVVRLRGDASFSQVRGEILELCKVELNPAAVPSVLAELKEFPLGSSGKVLAREVREMLLRQADARVTAA